MLTHQTDRRGVLRGLGRASLSGLLAPAVSLLRSDHAKAAREMLIQPPAVLGRNGEHNVTLTAAASPMRLGDVEFPGFLYNGSYLPPLLRVRLGDVLRVRFQNNIVEGFSNLHFHGLSVSPRARSDNVFIHVQGGHAPARCSSGASHISERHCSLPFDLRACRSTSSRPMDTRWHARARRANSCSAPASASTPLPSATAGRIRHRDAAVQEHGVAGDISGTTGRDHRVGRTLGLGECR